MNCTTIDPFNIAGRHTQAKYYPGYARNDINLLELIKERQGLENSGHPLL